MEPADLPPWDTPERTDWPASSGYPSERNPFHWDYELAQDEPPDGGLICDT